MRKVLILLVAGVLAFGWMASAQQSDALKAAADRLGVASIKALQFTGSGANFSVGQAYSPGLAWPHIPVRSYTALMNFDTGSMRVELRREMGDRMPRGGGAPITGPQTQIQVVSGNYAWNVPAPPPAATGAAPGPAPAPQPAPANQHERMLALWSTPQGFVKAAMANNATTKPVDGGATEISFAVAGKYKITGFINAQNLVERVQTWIDQSIVGDMLVETDYSGYKDFGGVLFPSYIAQKQDGHPSLDLTIASVTANPPADISVPANVRTAQAPPVTVNSQKLADGVFWLTGTHHSLAVEMKDHIVLVDTPNNEDRALAVIAKTKELIPNKQIRYVVTSHHHWDHLGGIRTAIDEGATIVTHQLNRVFLERAAKTPHTINPDRLSKSKKTLKIQTVGDTGKLTDGTRTIELYTIAGNEHAAGMLMIYLPKEKVLSEADAFSPPAQPTGQVLVTAVPIAGVLYDNIQRRKLDVQTIAPFHGGRTTDVKELARNAGRTSTTN